jgi:trk system potassium uptake protein TrkH
VLNIRLIFFVTGILLTILSAFMLLPAALDLHADKPDWLAFLLSSFLSAFVGIGLFLSNRGFRGEMQLRDAFIMTTLSWFVTAFFSALPFMFSELRLPLADAMFEAVSGLTTTGSTVIVGLNDAPPGILLWRALLQGLGGIGIIVLAIAVLPILKIGGMQLFRAESSDRSDKVMPRSGQISVAIGAIYAALTFTCAFALWAVGMTPLDAFCHAMSAVSTGGFSTKDASVGHYDSAAVEAILILFMIFGSLPFVLFVKALNGKPQSLTDDVQVRALAATLAVSVTLVALWLSSETGIPLAAAFRHAAFNVVSIVSTTGFVTQDYSLWGSFAVTAIFFLSAFGGCTGSTTGGIKMFRLYLLVQIARTQIAHLIQPHAVIQPRFNGKRVSGSVSYSVMSFVALYGASFMAVAVILSALGLDFLSAVSAAAASLGNVGPGIGPVVGPSATFAPLPDAAKWTLSGAMLLGRLEIFTILLLFSGRFWRL